MNLVTLIMLMLFFCGNLIFLVVSTTHYASLDILFLISFLIISAALVWHLRRPLNIAISSYLIFNYLFFFIAPLVQMHAFVGVGSFPNTMVFSYNEVALAITSIIIFNIVFFVALGLFEKNSAVYYRPIVSAPVENSEKYKITAFIMLGISIVGLVFVLPLIMSPPQDDMLESSKMKDLLVYKGGLFLPLFPAMYYARYFRKNHLLVVLAAVALLIIYKNPFIERRNALGPIYLTLIFFLWPKLMSSNARVLGVMSVALIIFFPIITIITHNKNVTIESLFNNQQIHYTQMVADVFTELHYDAFSNVAASIAYFKNVDITYGKQLLGSALFFFPRDLWEDKPLGSGQEIGNYLTDNFLMWFNNLSMPLVGEGWMNFGFFGVVLFAVILAFVVNHFTKWLYSGNFPNQLAAVYFAFHLVFLLRGDLMNGIAYFIGPFVTFFILPKFISSIFYKKGAASV